MRLIIEVSRELYERLQARGLTNPGAVVAMFQERLNSAEVAGIARVRGESLFRKCPSCGKVSGPNRYPETGQDRFIDAVAPRRCQFCSHDLTNADVSEPPVRSLIRTSVREGKHTVTKV